MAIILDNEASGLSPESYPIEVAWKHHKNHGWCDEFLIEPAPEWTHWNLTSAKIHNITREELIDSGIHVVAAATRLNLSLSQFGKVYVTAPNYDIFWLDTLFEAAKIERKFKVLDFMELTAVEGFDYDAMYSVFMEPTKHRAMADVDQIIKALNAGNKYNVL